MLDAHLHTLFGQKVYTFNETFPLQKVANPPFSSHTKLDFLKRKTKNLLNLLMGHCTTVAWIQRTIHQAYTKLYIRKVEPHNG